MSIQKNIESIQSQPKQIKSVVFKIAGYFFALPLTAVEKITLLPSETDSSNPNLINFDNRTITIINLNPHLTTTNKKQDNKKIAEKFLIITQTNQRETCGIIADQIPNLVNLPWSSIEQLSPSYRQHQILGLASYVSVLPTQIGKKLIFLLDLERAQHVALTNL